MDVVEVSIAIKNGRIFKIGRRSTMPKAEEKIDAHGMLILPGVIDTHVHFRDPGQTHKEDFSSGSKAAASGGVTTIFDMPNNMPKPTTSLDAIKEKKSEAKKKSLVNYGVYLGVTGKNINLISELARHVCGFKLYMGDTTGSLALEDEETQRKVFFEAAKTDRTLVVHAEDSETNKRFLEANESKDDVLAHTRSHPPESEAIGIERALVFARESNARVHITHLSTDAGLALLHTARKQGGSVSCDTTCHYLLLNKNKLLENGPFFKVTPPLRGSRDQNALWKGIFSQTIDLVSSDHAPHTVDEKKQGIWEAPSGFPSVGLTLPLLLTQVNNKRLSLKSLIELTAQNPARFFGLKKKGYIMEGFDADLVLVDPSLEKEVKSEDLYTKCGWSPYEGWTLQGWPYATIVGGKKVFEDGIIFNDVRGSEVKFGK